MLAAIALEKANMDPAERSMPPVKITKVIPTAIIAFRDVCLNTFNRFEYVKNLGLKIDKIALNNNRPITDLNFNNTLCTARFLAIRFV